MAMRLKQKIEQKFDEEIRFIKGWIDKPKHVGAILPTSAVTAKKMASIANPQSGLPVLELGPGTGIITKAILERGIAPEKLVAIEFSTDFYQHLVKAYPGVNFINGDAFDIEKTLGEQWAGQQFDCVISAIPLLHFPMYRRVQLIDKLLDLLPPGRPVIQITYGPVSPVIAWPDRYQIEHFDFIVRNIPPAQLWIYRRG